MTSAQTQKRNRQIAQACNLTITAPNFLRREFLVVLRRLVVLR